MGEKVGVEEFGKALVEHVRDEAIRAFDRRLTSSNRNAPSVVYVHDKMKECTGKELASALIPEIVDQTLFQLAVAIDQGLLPLKFVSAQGEETDLTESVDELRGWYVGRWCELYSKERFIDHSKKLKSLDELLGGSKD